jgi:hypothetical protein
MAKQLIGGLDFSPLIYLKSLDLPNNRLTSLNVSKNPGLENLDVSGNMLTSLKITHNPALEYLDASGNMLKTLGTLHNRALWSLNLSGNKLKALDVSHNPALEDLDVSDNELKSLKISSKAFCSLLNVDNNRLPLSQLNGLMSVTKSYIGHQQKVQLPGLPSGKMFINQPYDLSSEISLNDHATTFTITLNGFPASRRRDYKLIDGILVFLSKGRYQITMHNSTIYNIVRSRKICVRASTSTLVLRRPKIKKKDD